MPKLRSLVSAAMSVAILVNLLNFNLAYAKELQNDPTMPRNLGGIINNESEDVDQKTTRGGNLVLTAILTGVSSNSAIINDQLVHEKDKIAQYEVLKIENNKVVLKPIVNHEINEELNENSSNSTGEQNSQEKTIEIRLPAISIKE